MWKYQGRVATGRSFIDPVGRVDTGRLGTGSGGHIMRGVRKYIFCILKNG